MWRTVVLTIVNLGISSLGTLLLRLPGFDLTPIGIVMIARGGESIVLGSVLLTVSYMLPRPGRFAWIWLQVPVAVFAGYVAIWLEAIYIPIFVYHAISIIAGLLTGTFRGRYMLYTFINLGLNIVVARFYGLTI